jgi:1,4-alpha-glucan branching enzyme
MLTKKFLKKGSCKVEFVLPEALADGAQAVFLVGDFNDWDATATPMKKLKGPRFKVTVELDLDREYAFRYLVNGINWHNDPEADRYIDNPFGGQNSVVDTHSLGR